MPKKMPQLQSLDNFCPLKMVHFGLKYAQKMLKMKSDLIFMFIIVSKI